MDSGLRAQAPGYSSASASMMEATERSKMISTYGRRHPTDLVNHRMLGQPSTYDRQLKSIIGNVSFVSLCVMRPEYPLGLSIKRPVFVCARLYFLYAHQVACMHLIARLGLVHACMHKMCTCIRACALKHEHMLLCRTTRHFRKHTRQPTSRQVSKQIPTLWWRTEIQ